jgi:hypothetical protein
MTALICQILGTQFIFEPQWIIIYAGGGGRSKARATVSFNSFQCIPLFPNQRIVICLLCSPRLGPPILELVFLSAQYTFVHFDEACLSKYQFSPVLQKCLQFCDIPLYIRSHSFRIGRSTDLARFGVEDDHIKQCGRYTQLKIRKTI